jgi:hypothetical protein
MWWPAIGFCNDRAWHRIGVHRHHFGLSTLPAVADRWHSRHTRSLPLRLPSSGSSFPQRSTREAASLPGRIFPVNSLFASHLRSA